MLHVNQASYDDNVDSICVTGLREILERCENSRCVPKYKLFEIIKQNDNASNHFSSLVPMILAIKRRHSCTPWESEITLVEGKETVLGLRRFSPRNSEFEHSSIPPFLLTIK